MKKEGKSATEIVTTNQVEEEEEIGVTHAYMRHLQNVQAELGTQDLTSVADQEHPKVVSLISSKYSKITNVNVVSFLTSAP